MSNPWDVPPFPEYGDQDADTIYRAKGYAVCTWELVEVALSGVHAVFSGYPYDHPAAYREYGEPLNFRDRATRLEALAYKYFVAKPDQRYESTFDWLMLRARNFAIRRNEITHSVISYRLDGRSGVLANAYYLVPPDYTDRKFDENHKVTFVYISHSIEDFAVKFRVLAGQVDLFLAELTIDQRQ